MKTIEVKIPEIDDIEFEIFCLEEDEHPNNSFTLDDESQEELVNSILERLVTNPWAWCCIRLIGRYKGVFAETYLGCCSYESKEQFLLDDYCADMKNEVYNEIVKQLEKLAD